MSIVAWDGTTLAADKMAICSGAMLPATKIKRAGDIVLAWTGGLSFGIALADWYIRGADRRDWPEFQKTDDWCRLIVFDKEIFFFEQSPYAIPVEGSFYAWGSGRDFALASLYLGNTAVKAVAVASALCDSCGLGVDYFKVK